MEDIDQLADQFNQEVEELQADLGNLRIRRAEDTDSEVTVSDLEEEEIQNMADPAMTAHLSRFVGATGVRANARTEDEIAENINTTKKNEREALKTNNLKAYEKLKQDAMKGIEPKFDLLKAIEEGSKDEGFKAVYDVMSKTAAFERTLKESDMIDIFKIPVGEYDTDGMPVLTAIEVDLLIKSQSVTLADVRKANHFYSTLGQDYHLENIQWSGKKILNSCSDALKDKIMEATAHLPNSEQGGPVFWKVLMDLVIATSETAMRRIINKIATVKLSDFNGEDVTQCATFLRSSYTLLKNHDRIQVDMIYLLFQTLRECSTPYFVRRVEYCEQNRLSKIGGYDLISYEDLLNEFQILYADLIGRNGWEAKTTENQGSAFNVERKLSCWNCGVDGHGITDCTKPRNEADIEKRKKLWNSSRNVQPGRGNGAGNRDRSNRRGNGPSGRGRHNNNPSGPGNFNKKVPPKQGENHTKNVNGATWKWCGVCKCWTKTHGTAEHRVKADTTDDSSPPPAPNPGTVMQAPTSNQAESANQVVDLPIGATAYHF